MNILAFIPARGGSKSVHLKNMVRLDECPLVGWSLKAACESDVFQRVVVSTDHGQIKDYCTSNWPEAAVVERPKHLRDGRSYPIQNVVIDFIRTLEKADRPHAVALFQPTSPFVRQYQIEHLALQLRQPEVKCAYTITPVPHNYHWCNQRVVKDKNVSFMFPGKRQQAYNKQKKEQMYKFGNLVMTKTQYIKDGFFSDPAAYLEIDRFDAADIDDITDYKVARTMVEAGYWENGDR